MRRLAVRMSWWCSPGTWCRNKRPHRSTPDLCCGRVCFSSSAVRLDVNIPRRIRWRRIQSRGQAHQTVPCRSMTIFCSATLVIFTYVGDIYIHWRDRFFFLFIPRHYSQHSCIRIFPTQPFHVTFEVHLLCFMALNFSLSSMSLPMEAICNLSPFISSFVSKQQQERILTQSICITGLWWAWHRSGSRADCVASVGSRVSEENHWHICYIFFFF